ncbi:MAG: hypothetical protein JWN48_4095, partial [Myxococcaceae bacterium]|nr:hypothetical protein [Myxococcaceae bacterium]
VNDECFGRKDQVLCSAGDALTCVGGNVAMRTSCGELTCADGVGCRVCAPLAVSCDGNERYRCNADGSARDLVEECSGGLSCSAVGCANLCAEAAKNRSYLGCDYWPVFTSNSLLDPLFKPAVSVGNGNLVSAHVQITKDQRVVAQLDIPAGTAQTIELAFEAALQRPGGSRLVRQGAYHLTSSVPVTVHQFNPLLFKIAQRCIDPGNGEEDAGVADVCFSYTGDASLLFPSTALKQDPELTASNVLDFIAVSRSSFMRMDDAHPAFAGQPGFVAIVAVGDRPANVTVRSSAYTMASPLEVGRADAGTLALPAPDAGMPDAGMPDADMPDADLPNADSSDAGGSAVGTADMIEALIPGALMQRTLAPGDVLQLVAQIPSSCPGTLSASMGSQHVVFCDPGAAYDMTGTTISADAPVQVISGHDCANIPYDRVACDHIEESMVPLHAWGTSAVLVVPQTAAGSQYILRLVSGADQNVVTFDPPLHAPVTLERNQSFELLLGQSVFVRGTGRLMAAQHLLGQGRGVLQVGDPGLTVAVPIDQYRNAYNFISPATFVRNYVDIIATHDDVVTLDGKLVSSFTQVGQSSFSVATVELTEPGAHEVHGASGVGLGIVLYGLAPYTAYLLPGGLDLYPIGPIGI